MPKQKVIPRDDRDEDRKNSQIIPPIPRIIVGTEGDAQQIPGVDSPYPPDLLNSNEKKSSSRPITVNFRFLIIVCVIVAVVSTGSHVLHRYQVHSMADVYLRLAEKAKKEGDDERATSYYRNYLRLNPDDRAILEEYSLLYYRTAKNPREKTRAVFILENLLRKNESRDDFRRILVDAYLNFGRQQAPRYRGALRHIDYFLSENPDDLEMIEHRAECRWKLGDVVEAVTDYRTLIRKTPLRFDLFEQLAHIYRFDLDQIKKADRIMDDLVTSNPKSWKAYFVRAKYFRSRMLLRKSALDIRRALQLNKSEPAVLLFAVEMSISTRGLTDFSHVVELSELKKLLSQIVPNRDNEVEITLAIANLDLIDERPAEAMKRVTQIVDKYPKNFSLKRLLCELQIRFGKLDEAEKLIAEMKAESGNLAFHRYYEAWLLFERKQYLESINLLKMLLSDAQQNPSLASKVSILLADCYERIGWNLHQNNELNSALQIGDLGYFDLFRIALGFESLGKYDQALSLYRKFQRNATIVEKMAQAEIGKNLVRPTALQNWDSADSLVSALAQFPEKKGIAIRYRSEILAARKKTADGLIYVENELKKQPDNSNLTLTLVGLLVREKRFSEARVHLDRLKKSLGPTAELLASEIFYWTEHPSEDSLKSLHSLANEIEVLRTAHRLNENDTYRLEVSIAHAFDRKNELRSALEVWKKLSQRYPQDVSLTLSWLETARRLEDIDAVKTIVLSLEKSYHAMNPYLGLAKAVEAILEAKTSGKTQSLDVAIARLSSPELQTFRNTRQFLLAFARLYEAQNRIDDAIRYYETTIDSGDSRPEVFRHLIELLYRRGMYHLAENYLKRLKEESPEVIVGNFGRLATDISLRLHKNQSALEIAKRVVSSSPDDFRHRLWLAQILAIVGKNQDAEREFQETISMASSKPEPWVGYIFYLTRTSRKKEAVAAINVAASKIDSPYRDLALAQCYEQIGNFARAEAFYNKSSEKHLGDPNVKTVLADFYFRRGSFSKAEVLCDALIATQSKYAKIARRQKALILMTRDGFREFEQVLELVEKNIQDDPDSVIDELLKANILSKHPALTRRNEAIRILESVERRRTLNSNNRFLLARLYLSVGKWAKSRDLMQIVLATDRRNSNYLSTYIEQMILHRERNHIFESALKRLKSVQPESPNTAYLEMISLSTDNRLEDALKILEEGWLNNKGTAKEIMDSLRQKAGICSDLTQNLNAIGYAVQAQRFAVLADGFYKKLMEQDRSNVFDYARFLKSQFDITTALQLCEENYEFCSPEELAATVIELLKANPNEPENLQLAEKLLDRLEKQNPNSSLVKFQMANLEHIRGNYTEAIKGYRQTLEKIPRSVVALNELTLLLTFEGKNNKEARRRIEDAIRIAGPRANLLDTRAMFFYAQKNYTSAEKDLVQAIDQSPSAVKYYHLAQVKDALNRRTDARIALRKGISLGLQASFLHPLERKNFPEIVRTLNH